MARLVWALLLPTDVVTEFLLRSGDAGGVRSPV